MTDALYRLKRFILLKNVIGYLQLSLLPRKLFSWENSPMHRFHIQLVTRYWIRIVARSILDTPLRWTNYDLSTHALNKSTPYLARRAILLETASYKPNKENHSHRKETKLHIPWHCSPFYQFLLPWKRWQSWTVYYAL